MPLVDALKAVNLAVRLLVELAALAAFAVWGFQLGEGRLARIALGVGAPLAAAVVWGLFASPEAIVPIPGPAIVAVQALVLGLGVVALAAAGHPRLAAALALVMLLNAALMFIWRQ